MYQHNAKAKLGVSVLVLWLAVAATSQNVESSLLNCGALMKRCQVQCLEAGGTGEVVRWKIAIFEPSVSCERRNRSDVASKSLGVSNDFVTTFDAPCCQANANASDNFPAVRSGCIKEPCSPFTLPGGLPSAMTFLNIGALPKPDGKPESKTVIKIDNKEIMQQLETVIILGVATLAWVMVFAFVYLCLTIHKKKLRLRKVTPKAEKANRKERHCVLKDITSSSVMTALDSDARLETVYVPTPAVSRKNNTRPMDGSTPARARSGDEMLAGNGGLIGEAPRSTHFANHENERFRSPPPADEEAGSQQYSA